jgi:hypothetical protein
MAGVGACRIARQAAAGSAQLLVQRERWEDCRLWRGSPSRRGDGEGAKSASRGGTMGLRDVVQSERTMGGIQDTR